MILRACLMALAFSCASAAAFAQPLYGNPFADAATYRSTRDATPDATYRLRYEVTSSDTAQSRQVTIDVASDWSLVHDDNSATLHDFQLNRIFTIRGDAFSTSNGLALLAFRVMERQNRTYLRNLLSAAGAGAQAPQDCDADTELALSIPGTASESNVELRERRGVVTAMCGGREIGALTPSNAAAPPPAFWPTAFHYMTAHPALLQRMRTSGRPPALLEARYRPMAETEVTRSWRLIAVETVATAYPLNPSMRNVTAEQLDSLIAPGAGQIASDAIAGNFFDGALTLQAWDAHGARGGTSRRPCRSRDVADAVLQSLPGPQLRRKQCSRALRHIARLP